MNRICYITFESSFLSNCAYNTSCKRSFLSKRDKSEEKGKKGVDKMNKEWYNRQALQKRVGRVDP